MSNSKKTLVACSVFKDELEAVIPPEERPEIVWLDASLHADADLLEQELKLALGKIAVPREQLSVLFGCACHPELRSILNGYATETPDFGNCIEAFCGPTKAELEKDGAIIMTPAWIRAWPAMMRRQGWDETDFRINMGRYDKILVVDAGMNSLTDEETLEFFDLVQIPIETQTLDLSAFRERLAEILGR